MGLFSFLFGNKTKKIQEFVSRNAVIIDVRTKAEFSSGAIPGSKNIPLQQISVRIKDIKKWDKPVITCCATGMRSGSAAGILRSHGIEAMNGGGWANLEQKL
ncbi:MAG: rhodanese-like domain-containing protein [Bacteroidia bacterium]|nr:rhodanese-like domain-containing protein [Bacteroidia bacterium]NNF29810.1 rhodanese-like domain-containing protein [Flavobacteriaceae bacterium]MBT8275990.1 rhodanese-like domain-containing protein [Bacteroidia bacterium]NNJ82596.1 rhodanese-like domain-containing protein [Flavobacteriaceae bacterium]NNK55352.1 rhodanese-like domain-containing protein [Flavobacteriaceae bacterium]